MQDVEAANPLKRVPPTAFGGLPPQAALREDPEKNPIVAVMSSRP